MTFMHVSMGQAEAQGKTVPAQEPERLEDERAHDPARNVLVVGAVALRRQQLKYRVQSLAKENKAPNGKGPAVGRDGGKVLVCVHAQREGQGRTANESAQIGGLKNSR